MGESGNIVTDAYYNLELWQDDEGPEGTAVFKSYTIPLTARSHTFYNLKPGTHYLVKLYANRQKDRAIDRHWTKTLEPSNPTPGTPTLNVSANGNQISISGSKGSNTDYIRIYVDDTRVWNLYVRNSSTYSVTYNGNYSTRYKITAEPTNTWYVGSTVTRYITTGSEPLPDPPPAPTGLNMYDSGETWASFAWNAAPRADKYAMEIFRGNNLVPGMYDYNIFQRTKRFTGLSPGILYTAKLYGWNPGGNGTPAYLDFTLGYSRPSNFSWDITKARGRSYSLGNGRFTNLVSYDEFQSFRQRINDFRRYKGLSSYTFTNVGINTILSAALYNQLHYAINAMNPPTSTPGVKSSGASDVAGLLNGLRNSLNSIP